jgi:hypothetical protein
MIVGPATVLKSGVDADERMGEGDTDISEAIWRALVVANTIGDKSESGSVCGCSRHSGGGVRLKFSVKD